MAGRGFNSITLDVMAVAIFALVMVDVALSLNDACAPGSAACIGLECNIGCATNECAKCCDGDRCGAMCTAQRCAQYCDGFECAVSCHGDSCGEQCIGERCGALCRNQNCAKNCIGDGCAYDCTGAYNSSLYLSRFNTPSPHTQRSTTITTNMTANCHQPIQQMILADATISSSSPSPLKSLPPPRHRQQQHQQRRPLTTTTHHHHHHHRHHALHWSLSPFHLAFHRHRVWTGMPRDRLRSTVQQSELCKGLHWRWLCL
jgi:hypothetical protein